MPRTSSRASRAGDAACARNRRRLQTLVSQILEKSSRREFGNRKEEWNNYLDMNSLTCQVIDLQKDVPMPEDCGGAGLGSSRLLRVERLRSWLLEHGARIGAVQAVSVLDLWGARSGRQCGERSGSEAVGLLCCGAISRGEPVVEVPRSLMLTLDSPNTDSPLDCVFSGDKVANSLPQLRLALILLGQCLLPLVDNTASSSRGGPPANGSASRQREGGYSEISGSVQEGTARASWWRPYLQSLPREYETPLYFSPDELRCLSPSVTLDEVVAQFCHIVRQYCHFYQLIRKSSDSSVRRLLPHFTFKLFRWCVSAVMTRMNRIPSMRDSSSYVPALIPFWDLCNHSSGELSTDYDPDQRRSCCFAFRDFSAGQEFCIYYGARSNAQFFLHNGFVYEGNDEDSVQLVLGVSSSDRLRQLRLRLLKLVGAAEVRVWTLRRGRQLDDSLQSQLIGFCRVHVMDQDSLQWWLKHSDIAPVLNHLSWPITSPSEETTCQTPTTTSQPENSSLPSSDPLVSLECETAAWRFLHTRLSLLLKAYSDSGAPDDGDGNYSVRAELARRLCRSECRVLQHVERLVADRLTLLSSSTHQH